MQQGIVLISPPKRQARRIKTIGETIQSRQQHLGVAMPLTIFKNERNRLAFRFGRQTALRSMALRGFVWVFL